MDYQEGSRIGENPIGCLLLYGWNYLKETTVLLINEWRIIMKQTRKLVLSAFFMALGIVLPFFIGQIPQIGRMLLPMHIPILLCGFICGWQYGLVVGFVTPLLRGVMFGMPALMPSGAGMAVELAVYGLVTGIMYARLPKKIPYIYVSLLGAMIAGRIAWGIVSVGIYGVMGNRFSMELFWSGAILTAIPGIILQIVLVPAIMIALKKAGVLSDYETSDKTGKLAAAK